MYTLDLIKKYTNKYPIFTFISFVVAALIIGDMCGCASTGSECDNIAGLYLISSGHQTITDNTGQVTESDAEGAYVSVSQGGCAVSFTSCIGELKDNTVNCHGEIFGIDPMFGPFYITSDGNLNVDGLHLSGELTLKYRYNWADFSATNKLNFEADLDDELTQQAMSSDEL